MPKTETKAAKADKAKAAKAAEAEAELGVLEAVQAKLEPVAKALLMKVRSVGMNASIEASFSNSVLNFVVWAVEASIPMRDLYHHIEDHLANAVGDEARKPDAHWEAEDTEQIGKLTGLAQKACSALNGPFFNIAVCVADDIGRTLFLNVATASKATWGKARTHAKEVVAGLAFAEERHDRMMHYKPRDGGKISFTIGEAAIERDCLKDAQQLADSIYEEWSPRFKVVVKHYREGRTDIDMPDARSAGERDKRDAAITRALISKHGAEKIAELLEA
jgi:hypothetical protein